MKIFTDEYICQIQRRYGQLPDYEKPHIYFFVVSDEGQYFRNEVEGMITTLPPNMQKLIIPRMRDAQNFINTYNELAVGYKLNTLGYQVEYEKNFQGITPDWYVHSKGNIPDFIVEVFTTNSFTDKSREYWRIKNLEERLRQIPIGATLEIKIDKIEQLNSERNKQITKKIQQWLIQEDPPAGSLREDSVAEDFNFTCEVVNRDTDSLKLKPYVVPGFYLVDTERLAKSIKEKTKKYKNLGMPLVVGVVTDNILGEELRNVLIGGRRISFYYNQLTGKEESTTILLNNGLFRTMSELSAVIWVRKAWSEWKMSAIHNPTTVKPLPPDTFGEEDCPLYELTP